MSDQDKDRRIHPPTPRRIKEFRKRGDIATSKDVTTTATLAGGLFACVLFSGAIWDAIRTLMAQALSDFGATESTIGATAATTFAVACLPAAVGALSGYLLAVASQLGWPPAFKRPKFDLTKPLAFGSIKNILSPIAMARRALNSTAKVTVVALAGALAVTSVYERFMATPALDATAVGARIVSGAALLVSYAGGALAALAALDYVWQRRQLMAKMRMTPEEIKRENREQEGDPLIKRERKRRQREIAQRRLPAQVKTADVVVVNPTRYAVALRYRVEDGGAPVVVAKGRGTIAQRIRELARKTGIPVLTRPPVTRLLHKLVPEGHEIPAQLYHAVAEILALVYRLQRRSA